MGRLVFILGYSNTADGILSSASLGRIEAAISVQKTDPKAVLLATGGFGSNFNVSDTSHRELVHRVLEARGASFDRAGPTNFLSANTVEDIAMIRDFARAKAVAGYDIVTSRFHALRCRFILNCLAVDQRVGVIEANDPADLGQQPVEHEVRALAQLYSQRGVMWGGVLHRHPKGA
jgi:hypothetical protein